MTILELTEFKRVKVLSKNLIILWPYTAKWASKKKLVDLLQMWYTSCYVLVLPQIF